MVGVVCYCIHWCWIGFTLIIKFQFVQASAVHFDRHSFHFWFFFSYKEKPILLFFFLCSIVCVFVSMNVYSIYQFWRRPFARADQVIKYCNRKRMNDMKKEMLPTHLLCLYQSLVCIKIHWRKYNLCILCAWALQLYLFVAWVCFDEYVDGRWYQLNFYRHLFAACVCALGKKRFFIIFLSFSRKESIECIYSVFPGNNNSNNEVWLSCIRITVNT